MRYMLNVREQLIVGMLSSLDQELLDNIYHTAYIYQCGE
jgi:hypothetical protein